MAATAMVNHLALRFNSLASLLSSLHAQTRSIEERLERLEFAASSSDPRRTTPAASQEVEARLLALETTSKDFYQRSSAFDNDIDQVNVGVNALLEQFKGSMKAEMADMFTALWERLVENIDSHVSAEAFEAAADNTSNTEAADNNTSTTEAADTTTSDTTSDTTSNTEAADNTTSNTTSTLSPAAEPWPPMPAAEQQRTKTKHSKERGGGGYGKASLAI